MTRSTISRRAVVHAGLAASAALVAGCATTAAKPRVVVLGGGWGGLGAARTLARSGKVEVTLVEANDAFMSCPPGPKSVLSSVFVPPMQRKPTCAPSPPRASSPLKKAGHGASA